MQLLVSEILELVDKAKTKQEKVNLLKKHEMPILRAVLRINFDPNVQMLLPEGEPPYKKEPGKPAGLTESTLHNEYRRFYIWLDPKQQITKAKRESLFIEMLESLHVSEADVIILAKDRKLTKKYKTVKEDVVREAYPYTLPPKLPAVKTKSPN